MSFDLLTYHALAREGFETIEELLEVEDPSELLDIRAIGPKRLHNLYNWLVNVMKIEPVNWMIVWELWITQSLEASKDGL